MASTDTINRALDVNDANLRLGNEVFETPGATFVRNRGAPDIYDANHVTGIKVGTAAEIDDLLQRVETEFAGYAHRRFDTDHRTHPTLIARLHLAGYERSEGLVMLLDGDLVGAVKKFDIRAVGTEADWGAFEDLKTQDWLEARRKQGLPPALEVARSMAGVDRGKCPPVQCFLAFVDGTPVAYLNAWQGTDGIGQVENLFTLPEHRNRGIATALIHRCVTDCRDRGADQVIIVADPSDTPMQMYAAMGFRPIAAIAHYWKRLGAS